MGPETRKERREERTEQRRERRERHRGEKSILVIVYVSRVRGRGPKLVTWGPRTLVRAWVYEGLASTSAVSLRFRLDSRFL